VVVILLLLLLHLLLLLLLLLLLPPSSLLIPPPFSSLEVRASMTAFFNGLADGSVVIFDHVNPDIYHGPEGLQSLLNPALNPGK